MLLKTTITFLFYTMCMFNHFKMQINYIISNISTTFFIKYAKVFSIVRFHIQINIYFIKLSNKSEKIKIEHF